MSNEQLKLTDEVLNAILLTMSRSPVDIPGCNENDVHDAIRALRDAAKELIEKAVAIGIGDEADSFNCSLESIEDLRGLLP